MAASTMTALVLADASASQGGDGFLLAALLLLGVGIVLLVVEAFVPTGGILGLITAVAFLASLVAMYLWSPAAGLLMTVVLVLIAPFAGWLLIKLWKKSPIVRAYTLESGPAKVVTAEGTSLDAVDPFDPDAAQLASDHARSERIRALAALIGERGIAETPLRPSGFARIDGRRVDATAESGFIDAGTPVRVVSIVDGTLKVRADAGP
jgi:membrane-bound ClpP family serine protease